MIYPNIAVDEKGEPLTGTNALSCGSSRASSHRWPRCGTWPCTTPTNFFVDNQLGRYTIGSTTDGLQPAADRSLTIAIQHQQPADAANWLPAPTGPFNLTLRFYGPDTSVLDGSYRLPAIQRVS